MLRRVWNRAVFGLVFAFLVSFALPDLSLKEGETLLQLNAVEEPESPATITTGSEEPGC